MRIAVVGKCQYSMFSGSQANATLAVAEAIKLHGHDVSIISYDANTWWDDVKLLKKEWEGKVLGMADVKEPFDIVFEVGHMFETVEERQRVAKKSIYVARKHAAIDEIEHSLFPTSNSKRCWDSISEIWAFDAFCNSDDVQILETLSRLPVYVVPYVWTPSIVEKHREETQSPLWIQLTASYLQEKGLASLPWSFHVAETNTTSASSCTLPTLIVREAMLKKSVSARSLRIHNADHVYKSKFFQDNVWKHARVDDLSGEFVGRQRVIDWVFEPMSCVITHQRFNPFRPMLFDLAWAGLPFIHNSDVFCSIGNGLERFYYKDNRISEGVECLQRMNEDFLARSGYFKLESINAIRKSILEKMSPYGETVHRAWGSHLARFSGITPVPVTQVAPVSGPVYLPSVPGPVYLPSVSATVPVAMPAPVPAPAPVTAAAPVTAPAPVPAPVPNTLTVGFCDMWADFNPTYNFFTLLLEEGSKNLSVTVRGVAAKPGDTLDLLIFGPFGTTWRSFPEALPKAHYTGENTPPQEGPGVGLNMCFPHTDMISDNYIRLPLWILEIDWFGADPEKIVNPKPIPIDRCTQTYPEEMERKKKFCAFVVSNPSNPVRNLAFQWLSTYKEVDSAGALYNNMGPILAAGPGGGGGELKKFEFLKEYKFCIAYENSSFPGYVTEKLLHAKAAGCIPIYWGDPKVNRDFNTDGFIDAGSFKSASDLLGAVSRVDNDPELWKKMFETPALDTYKLEWTRRTLAQCATRLLTLAMKKEVKLPRFLGASSTSEADQMRVARNPKTTSVEVPLLVTFATRRFLPSLQLWLSAVDAQKKSVTGLDVRVYYGDDIPEDTLAKILENYTYVTFHKIPTVSPDTFKDMWDPQHFVWKIWIYYTLVNDASLKNRMVFYTDAGCFMCRWPTEWLLKAQETDICFLEDAHQTNEQWCHREFNVSLRVTEEEKRANQIVAGILIFRSGSDRCKSLFAEAWTWAQERRIIVGEKWSGRLADGRPYGHRHDQSILSILSKRHGVARYPLDKVYCDVSLRKTHSTGRSIYCHRGNFTTNKQFTDGIDDCYIISLDRRSDRMDRLYQTTPELKERATRFSAIEGKKLSLTPALARLFRPHDFMWKKAIMGCALSHLSLWWKLANEHQDINNYLILEDDVKLKPEWEGRWRAAKAHLPEDWDIIYLGGILPPNRAGFETCKERVNEHFSRVGVNGFFGQKPPNRYFHWCAYSYVLSKRGAIKVLDILMARDGYWTSADHMLCNPVNQINMYFLDPLVSGCYQDEDPKYATSAFNDFSRIDSFDSDLWNNDERFTKEEVERLTEETQNTGIDISKALAEARAMSISSAATTGAAAPVIAAPAPVVVTAAPVVVAAAPAAQVIPPISTAPTLFKHRLVCLEEHALDLKLLYENEWIYELFGKPGLLPIDKVKPNDPPFLNETPIVFMQRPLTHKYNMLLRKWSAAGGKFYIFHLSDEHCVDDTSSYTLPGCLKVVRMYDRPDLTEEERSKIIIIPLGYHWTLRTGGCPYPLERTPRLPFRSTRWTFFGTNWKKRADKFAPLLQIEPNRCKFLDEWNSKDLVGYEEYLGTMLDTVFVPCPGGNNVETYRFYEALECGCVPVIVREPGDELFIKMITDNLPVIPVKTWDEAAVLMQQLYADKNLLESYRGNILNGWRMWKEKLIEQVKAGFHL